jgi:hypothetical protein
MIQFEVANVRWELWLCPVGGLIFNLELEPLQERFPICSNQNLSNCPS